MSSAEWSQLLRGSSDADVVERLQLAVRLAYDVAPGLMAGCSITEIDGTKYSTPASSNQLAVSLDTAQYEAGRGPCMAAARDHQVHHLEDLRHGGQFDHFASAAVGVGVLSSLSLPLDGTYRPAALNLYATSPGAFANRRSRRIAALLARVIAGRMLQSDSGARGAQPHGVLSSEIQTRADLIRRAQLRLTTEQGSSEQAFTAMAVRSRDEARSIFDIAREILSRGESPS